VPLKFQVEISALLAVMTKLGGVLTMRGGVRVMFFADGRSDPAGIIFRAGGHSCPPGNLFNSGAFSAPKHSSFSGQPKRIVASAVFRVRV
jgi:hypothetical protein